MMPGRFMELRLGLPIVLILAVLGTRSLPAQQAPASQEISLAQAVKVALEKNPQRKAALADTRVASADIKAGSIFPAAADHIFRDSNARQRSRLRLWQQIAGTRIHYLRLRAQRAEYADAVCNFATRLGGTWNLFRFVCELACCEPGATGQGRIRASTRTHRTGSCFPRGGFLLRRAAGEKTTGTLRSSVEDGAGASWTGARIASIAAWPLNPTT